MIRSLRLTLALLVTTATTAAPSQSQPLGKHVWDHAALSRCSSPYKREVFSDPHAQEGRAVRFTGQAWFISMHDEVRVPAGRNRFTVRLRMKEGSRLATDLEVGGKGFVSRAPLEISDFPADGSFVQRTVELNLPGNINVVSLRGGLPTEITVDRIEAEPVAGASTVEVASARLSKLLYAPEETGEATVLLANYGGREQTVRLRLVVEGRLKEERVLVERDVPLSASTALQAVTVPVAALPKGGYLLRAEAIVEGKAVSTARDVFAVSDRPLRAGQYGAFSLHQPYSAVEAEPNVRAMRRNFATVAEICFWAPCDMSQLVPPSGKDRWWSGQTAQRFSTEQLRTCIAQAHEQGIRVLGYADYSVAFGYRVYDFGRRFPDLLDWRTQNDSGFVWLGFDADTMGLRSPLRAEDDASKDVKVSGVARTLHTHPAAFRWHADQLVAAMKHFGWDGFRYDDPIDYDARQVDLLGREAPLGGCGLAEIVAYSRRRIEAARPGALLGHNGDPMRASSDAMYVSGDPQRMDRQETAALRAGGFLLQEGWSNWFMAPDAKGTWTQWRERNVTAGRAAHRAGGDVCVITDIRDHAPAWRKSLITALLLAAGNHIAYNREGDRSFLALASRHCDLIYGDELRWLSAEDAARTVQVDAGSRKVWWQDYVRLAPTQPGKRVYLVHLINPPEGDLINTSRQPQPLKDLHVAFTLPSGWKPSRAWLVGTERHRPFVESVVSRTRRNDGREEPYLERLCGQEGTPYAEPLLMSGAEVSVPEIKLWGIVALECDGPPGDATPSDVQPLFAAPKIPDPTAPIQAAKASEAEFARLGPWSLAGGDRKKIAADQRAAEGRAARLDAALAVRVQRNPGLNWGWVQPIPAGMYRITARCRAAQPLAGKLTLTCSTATNAHEQNKFPKFPKFQRQHQWDLAGILVDRYGTLSVDMKWEEMPNEAELRFETTSPGVLVQDVLVECLKVFDTERVEIWKGGWPAGAKLTPHRGTNVWFAQGLYHDYYRLDQALGALPGPVTVDRGTHFKVGQHPTGFKGTEFPSAEKLAGYDLVIIADVDLITLRVPNRDCLRGWVEAGGKLVMLGGPYGFGSGDWHVSDLLAPMYPAEISGRFDLQPAGAEKPAILQPASAMAKTLDWSKPPVVLWQHVMRARPDATVHVTAGGHPVILSRRYGAGKVSFVTAAPLGDAPAGQTAFWDWPQWPQLMGAVIRDLLQPEGGQPLQAAPSKADAMKPPAFAYDPEKEEGPHPESDFEWWYHFGFLKKSGSADYQYSFVSSFQRSKAGRYLFYNLSDLTNGKNHHHAVLDKSLLSGLALLLPEGHAFLPPPAPPSRSPKSELWFAYGENRLEKQADGYRAFYRNPDFVLDLALRRQGTPLPVLGSGLTGVDKPEDQHYYSFPRLPADGRLQQDGRETTLVGTFWYDHQWGKVTTRDLMKWCWWGIRLENGQDVNVIYLQNSRTGQTVQKGLTLRHPDGRTEVCRELTVEPDPKSSWTSPHARTYFLQWRIKAPTLGVTMNVRAFTDDHELPALLYKWIWEGPCKADVSYADGRTAKGMGFQEMIGHRND